MSYIEKYFKGEDSHLPIRMSQLRMKTINSIADFSPVDSSWHVHVICLKGTSSWQIGRMTVHCEEGDFVDQVNSDSMALVQCSSDFEAIMLALERGFVTSLLPAEPPFNYTFMKYMTLEHHFHLSEQSLFRIMHGLFEIATLANRNNKPRSSKMLRLALQLYLFEIATCFANDVPITESENDTSMIMVQLFRNFLKELDEHAEKEHSVLFYASQLNVTPQYLNKVVKQISGDTVKVWINKRLLGLISHRLLNSSDTVQQIAYRFNFSDAAMLTKYFKTYVKKTPSQFRLE
ncbi:MAG: helix-turn-helix domain-containing protein [Prevotella sp.]|jgi:AraC-like DNA-binding protein